MTTPSPSPSPPNREHGWTAKRHRGIVTFSGDELPMEENALVIANHRAWSDFYLIHALAQQKRMLDNCKYFVKVGGGVVVVRAVTVAMAVVLAR